MNIFVLLKKITDRPWRVVPNSNTLGHRINSAHTLVVIGSMNYEDATYASHAANVLPVLLDGLQHINRDAWSDDKTRLRAIARLSDDLLKLATEVHTEP